MNKRILSLFLLCLFFKGFSQDQRVVIQGKAISNTGSLENIHVININSKKAVLTDLSGAFEIPVKESDTLLFSAIQFEKKIHVITKFHMSKLQVYISLKTAVNKLNIVDLPKAKNMAGKLDLPNAGKKPLNKLEGRLNYHTKASVPVAIIATLLGQKGGIEDLFYIFSGNRKKDRKLKELIDKDTYYLFQSEKIQEIREYYGEAFFKNTLNIPKEEIDFFIRICDRQGGVIGLFSKNRKLEVIDIFIKEHKNFRN